MEWSAMRILLPLIAGIGVVAISFFVTLRLMDYWLAPPDPNASVIHVVESTYGLSCKDFTPPAGHSNQVKFGNITEAVAKACDMAKTSCPFAVDVDKLVDPATGCGKDFNVRWRCGADPEIHQFHLPAEASGRSALLSCPAN